MSVFSMHHKLPEGRDGLFLSLLYIQHPEEWKRYVQVVE